MNEELVLKIEKIIESNVGVRESRHVSDCGTLYVTNAYKTAKLCVKEFKKQQTK